MAVITAAILALPLWATYQWLQTNHPRTALALFVLGYGAVIIILGCLAWSAWWMLLQSYRPSGFRTRTVLHDPWALYFALLYTAATLFGLLYWVRGIIQRVTSGIR